MKKLLHLTVALALGTPAFAETDPTPTVQRNDSQKLAMLGQRNTVKLANNVDYNAASYVVGMGVGAVIGAIWTQGVDMTFGGGASLMRMRNVALRTDYGEISALADKTTTSPTLRFDIGYQIDEDWGLRIAYQHFGEVEASFAQPNIAGPLTGIPGPSFSRNVLKYSAGQLALTPTYTIAADERFRILAIAGLTLTSTKAQFENTYYAQFSGRPPGTFFAESNVEKEDSWGYLAGFSGEMALGKHFYVALSALYSPLKIALPKSIPLAWRSAVPSKTAVTADCLALTATITARY